MSALLMLCGQGPQLLRAVGYAASGDEAAHAGPGSERGQGAGQGHQVFGVAAIKVNTCCALRLRFHLPLPYSF